MTKRTQEKTKNRKKEYRTVLGSALKPNPLNWRKHPNRQRDSLSRMLDTIGDIDVLKVVEEADGTLMLLDGHLRASIRDNEQVDVVILDLTEEEQRLVLATFDPLGALAVTDEKIYEELTAMIDTEDDVIQDLLDSVGPDKVTKYAEDGMEPEELLRPELFERHDYVVFYFDNELDWQVAYENLNLPRVASAKVGGKTLEQKGESRILPGQVLLDLFKRD